MSGSKVKGGFQKTATQKLTYYKPYTKKKAIDQAVLKDASKKKEL
jgi:hypothetical protein